MTTKNTRSSSKRKSPPSRKSKEGTKEATTRKDVIVKIEKNDNKKPKPKKTKDTSHRSGYLAVCHPETGKNSIVAADDSELFLEAVTKLRSSGVEAKWKKFEKKKDAKAFASDVKRKLKQAATEGTKTGNESDDSSVEASSKKKKHNNTSTNAHTESDDDVSVVTPTKKKKTSIENEANTESDDDSSAEVIHTKKSHKKHTKKKNIHSLGPLFSSSEEDSDDGSDSDDSDGAQPISPSLQEKMLALKDHLQIRFIIPGNNKAKALAFAMWFGTFSKVHWAFRPREFKTNIELARSEKNEERHAKTLESLQETCIRDEPFGDNVPRGRNSDKGNFYAQKILAGTMRLNEGKLFRTPADELENFGSMILKMMKHPLCKTIAEKVWTESNQTGFMNAVKNPKDGVACFQSVSDCKVFVKPMESLDEFMLEEDCKSFTKKAFGSKLTTNGMKTEMRSFAFRE